MCIVVVVILCIKEHWTRNRSEYIRLTHGHFTRNKTNFYTPQSLMPPNGSISILFSRSATESQSGEECRCRQSSLIIFDNANEPHLSSTHYYMHRNHLIYYAIVPKGALVPWTRDNGGNGGGTDSAMSKRWQKRQNIWRKIRIMHFLIGILLEYKLWKSMRGFVRTHTHSHGHTHTHTGW